MTSPVVVPKSGMQNSYWQLDVQVSVAGRVTQPAGYMIEKP
jgi:hypothetical protein